MNETSTRPPRPDLFDEGLFDDGLFPTEPGDPAGSHGGSPRGAGMPSEAVDGSHGGAPRGAGLLASRAAPSRDRTAGRRAAQVCCWSRTERGTRRGPRSPRRSRSKVRELSGVQVEPCYVDVRHPTPAEALARMPGPVVAVPMFLAAGYHVRVDVPAQLAATGRDDVTLAETFGPDPALVAAAAARLRGAGMRDGDAVVLAVAGSSDPFAQADGATAAERLARVLRAPVTLATIAAGGPRVGEAVARLRAEGASRVAIASWLLAPGLFRRSLAESGADVVAEPLATHGAVAGLVIARYTAALSRTGPSRRASRPLARASPPPNET